MTQPRIRVPSQARKGEVIEIKTLIYLAFYTVATESGRLHFEWLDDDGTVYTAEAELTVV
jgi:hypothetical protein